MSAYTDTTERSVADRVYLLLQHLGIDRTHVVGSMREVLSLLRAHPDVVASLTLVCPFGALPSADDAELLGSRLLVIHGDSGPGIPRLADALAAMVKVNTAVLREYVDVAWADPAADRSDEVKAALIPFLEDEPVTAVPRAASGDDEGEVAGIAYRAHGAGPPLVMFPLPLAASQWEPLLPSLGERFRTIILGGSYIGAAEILARRVHGAFGSVARAFVHEIAPRPEERLLEVGCGTGETAAMLARYTGGVHPIIGIDVSPYMLREAATLVRARNLADRITLREGNAESLPFPDETFDLTFSCTVMEEVNADRMLSEMLRVTRPGGRVAVMVRSVDLRRWVNLPLPPDLRARVELSAGAGVSEDGCADASLYRRFVAAGLTNLVMGPKYGTNQGGPGFAETRAGFEAEGRVGLTRAELQDWDAAVAQSDAEGTFMWSVPYHCAVGTKA